MASLIHFGSACRAVVVVIALACGTSAYAGNVWYGGPVGGLGDPQSECGLVPDPSQCISFWSGLIQAAGGIVNPVVTYQQAGLFQHLVSVRYEQGGFAYTATVSLDMQNYQCSTGFIEATGVYGEPICLSVDACPFPPGQSFVKQGTGAIPSSVCQGSCQSQQQGPAVQFQGGWIASFAITGPCGGGDTSDAEDGLNCVSNGVASYCMDPTAQTNCGTVNGEYVCLDTVPPGNCIFLGNGDAVCAQGATTETPDLELDIPDGQGGTQTIGVHGGGVSSDGAGGAVGGTDDTVGDGVPGGPGGPGGGDGGCEGTACQGDLPPANEAVADFGTLFSTFWGRVEAAPIVQSVTGLAGSMPAGSCQPVSSDPIAFLGGTTLQLDTHCTLWPQLVPIINGVMLAAWALLGGIIIFRA